MEKILTLKKQKHIFNKPKLNIFVFFLCVFLDIWLDGFLFSDKEMPALYPMLLLIVGYVFWESIWLQLLMSILITFLRYSFIVNAHTDLWAYLLTWMVYFLTVLTVSFAIKYYRREKETTLSMIIALAKSLDSRDSYTANHSENVAYYALLIANKMKLSRKHCSNLYIGGLLHDIGKIGVPELILTKPGKLTLEEYRKIQSHPTIGYDLVKHITSFKKNGILDMILYHHERFDGKGYPKGLQGDEISLDASIIAVADAFDAMTSKRVYRDEFNLDFAIDEIRKNRGIQFNPKVANIFLEILENEKEKIFKKRFNQKKIWGSYL